MTIKVKGGYIFKLIAKDQYCKVLDIKPLQGIINHYRLRIGKNRVCCRIDKTYLNMFKCYHNE
ncbi:hypothetical protein MBAV_004254 [Candidatus Magnetobacterium bavaricum]|uniref:Uncharacterized protein n=1 Tax=Candidatus Magnetobacterium bavaricum TaxID=29290 RepID=A0A0F3GNN4_9BACT|nr:hypothetical protein MBAV_004254 [Candidatus Magnetobacterium bavaricum]